MIESRYTNMHPHTQQDISDCRHVIEMNKTISSTSILLKHVVIAN